MNECLFRSLRPAILGLQYYHRHEVIGLENVPLTGRALVVINHSLATYDAVLLGLAIQEETGRFMRPLADRLMFRIPGVRWLARELGIVEGAPENGRRLLESDELVMVAPGGMREALRPSTRAFQLDWERRLGFLRLAAATRTPILLAACAMADRIYDVYSSPITRQVYERLRMPVPFVRGLGLTWIPRPVKLIHRIGPPIRPVRATTERGFERWHARVIEQMEDLMQETRR